MLVDIKYKEGIHRKNFKYKKNKILLGKSLNCKNIKLNNLNRYKILI